MFLTKLKTVAMLLVLGMIACGAGLLMHHTAAGEPITAEQDVDKPASRQAAPPREEGVKPTSKAQVFFALKKVDVARRTLSVSLLGTNPTIDNLPIARDAKILGHSSLPPIDLSGQLSDLGVPDTPLTLEFAPDGKTITRITYYRTLDPVFLMGIDGSGTTITVFVNFGLTTTLPLSKMGDVFIDGKQGRAQDLRLGMVLELYPVMEEDQRKPPNTTVRLGWPRHKSYHKTEAFSPVFAGIVEKVDAETSSVTLTLEGTKLVFADLPVARDVAVLIDGKQGKMTDLKKGARVIVELCGQISNRFITSPLERRVVSLRTAASAQENPKKVERDADLNKLQGQWKLVDADDSDGLLKRAFAAHILVIQGNQMSVLGQDGEEEDRSPFQLSPGKDPKQIDFKVAGKGEELQDRVGIYALDGKKLKICFSTVVPAEESRRPTDFTVKPGSGRVLLVYERVEEKKVFTPEQIEKDQPKGEITVTPFRVKAVG